MKHSFISKGRSKAVLAVAHWMIAFGVTYIIHRELLFKILQIDSHLCKAIWQRRS